MSDLTLFKGNPLINSELFASIKALNKKLAGSSGIRRISLRGKKFRLMNGGEQLSVSKEDWMNVVILDAASVHRTYYKGVYSSDDVQPPTCWSLDTEAPAPEVPEDQRQATRCADCPMNVRGSGQGDTRACRYSQRLAIALEGDLDKVYQLQLPATSIFGDAKGSNMPLQAYVRFLDAHDMPVMALVTKMYLDEDADVPKVYFSAERPLDEEELQKVLDLRTSPDAKRAVEMTVSQADGAASKPAKAAEPAKVKPAVEAEKPAKAKPKAKVEEPEEDEDDAPPKRVAAKKAQPVVEETALADLVDEWDDD
jgi:hypothetical protein